MKAVPPPPPAIAAMPEVGAALGGYVALELAAAAASLAMGGGRIHAGVHRARKAIRRTRAVLALGGAALGAGATLLDRDLCRLNRSLSPLRDAHALVETLQRLRDRARDEDLRRLLHRAARIAAARRAACVRAPAQLALVAGARQQVLVLHAALRALPWPAVTVATCTDALRLTGERIGEARRRATGSDHDRDWHRLRRRMRRMSQQRHACAEAGWPPAEDSLFDKSLAEQLGTMQDLSLLLAHCGHDAPFAKDDRTALRHLAEAMLRRQRRRVASVLSR